MTLKRIDGETLCADCSRPACWQIATDRYTKEHDRLITGVLLYCDDCLGSLRSLIQSRHWDHEHPNKGLVPYRPHRCDERWRKRCEGIEP